MALMSIAEPGQSQAPHEKKIGVGIDLGTTHSLVAVRRNGHTDTLPDADGKHLLPSVVYYGAADPEVGHAALQRTEDPLNTIASVKRLMGRGIEDLKSLNAQLPYEFESSDVQGMPRIKTDAGNKSPVQVSADILRALRTRAEETLGEDLFGAVITVPAYFDDAQRQATKDAAEIAGLNVLRLINEPTAAAVAYGLDNDGVTESAEQADRTIVIYDLGGGTFDVSILRLQKGVFEVLSTGGDTALGGDDIDREVAQWVLQTAAWNGELSPQQYAALLSASRRAKEQLSARDEVSIELEAVLGWQGSLTRAELDNLLEPMIAKSLRSCRKALRDAKLKVDAIDAVVLVGGSTRIPYVRSQLEELFGQPPLGRIDPDRVVAIGAAVQADTLAGNSAAGDRVLLDVLPLSLGVETMGGLAEKIIHRNTPIPVAMAQEFTTYKDGQTAMSLHVVQGERDSVEDCRSLARFELRGIPPMVAGAARIRVSYQVDADGLLNVTAEEASTGVKTSVEVKPSYGLADSEVVEMLQESFANAEQDKIQRALQEARVDAERAISALEAALAENGDSLLPAVERNAIEVSMQGLQQAAAGDDEPAIQRAIEALNECSGPFAARRMDETIQRALSGHNVEEFDPKTDAEAVNSPAGKPA